MNSKKTTCPTLILRHCILTALMLLCGISSTSLSADNGDVPLNLQVKLLLTALTYDRNLTASADDILTIGMLYFPDSTHSQEQAFDFNKALLQFKDKKVKNLRINTIVIKYMDNADLTKKISEHNIKVLYSAAGRGEKLRKVIEVTRSMNVLTCTSDIMNFYEYELSLGIGLVDNKPKIYLNIYSAKAEGADFSAKLLRVVQFYDPGF